MANKRILHISKYYPPYAGGIEYVCYQVVSTQPQFEHSVICFSDTNKTIVDEYEGVRVVRVGSFAKMASQALSISYLYYLKSEIKRFHPDIIHFHAPNPLVGIYLLWVIPRGVKLIVHYHAEILSAPFLYRCYRFWEQCLFRRADVIVVTSPNLMAEALPIQKYRYKCKVIENTISIEDLELRSGDDVRINEIKKRYGNKKLVFAFGRHVPYKGFNCLLAADPMITQDCEIIIGGKGPITEELKKQIRSKRVHFIGRISDDELRCYLHAADIFAFPSLTRAEAFGVALVQAMYCGLPAVTFTIQASGVNYVSVNGKTGIEVPNGDVRAYANAITELLKNEELRFRLGKAANDRVLQLFTTKSVARKIFMLYENI